MLSPFKRRSVWLFALIWLWPVLLFAQAPGKPTNVTVNAKPAQPTITLLSPSSGAVGTSVTITGSGFAATQGSGTVTFNGIGAAVTAWSSLSITATVPASATTGPVRVIQNGLTSTGVDFVVNGSSGTTWTLPDCNRATLQTQHDSASVVSGDTIVLAAGTCDWNAQLVITKCITIRGQGTSAVTATPTIIRDASATDNLITWTIPAGCDGTSAGRVARWTGMEFRLNGGALKNHGVIAPIGNSTTDRQARIDHNAFISMAGFSISSFDLIGVVDHNTFTGLADIFIEVMGTNWSGAAFSNKSWSEPPYYGSARSLFFEDNVFTQTADKRAVTDQYLGGRGVFRYNTLYNGWFELHGTDSTQGGRGARQADIYFNKYICTIGLGLCNYAANFRSGTGVIHDNAFYQYTGFFALAAYRLGQEFGPWGEADGYGLADLNNAGTPFETNTATSGVLTSQNASTGTMTRTGAGWTLHQWQGYSLKKTGCLWSQITFILGHATAFQCSGVIIDNTADTITYEASSFDTVHLSFSSGDGYTIGKATEVLDQPGRGEGTEFVYRNLISNNSCTEAGSTVTCTCAAVCTGVGLIQMNDKVAIDSPELENRYQGTYVVTNTPTTTSFTFTGPITGLSNSNYGGVMKLPATNDQIDEPLYEWNNCVDSQNPPRIGCGGGGTNADFGVAHPYQIRINEHFFNDTVKPGYPGDYTYPHPLTVF